MTRIAVIDHGAGNLVSIEQALLGAGADVVLARGPRALEGADALVLPGVGAAGPAMARLEGRGLVEPIRAWAAADRPLLGICLGLQLLFDGSDEDGAETLGVLAGRSVRLQDAPRLPHIGWNDVHRARPHPLFDGTQADAPFYFVHSYAVAPAGTGSADIVLATAEHGRRFVAAVARGHLAGVQFHPERSGADGLRLIGRFVAMAAGATVGERAGSADGRRTPRLGRGRRCRRLGKPGGPAAGSAA